MGDANQTSDDTREALITAAAGIVGDVGPEGLNISYVARRAGVPRELAYEHFESREALINAINQRIGHELESVMMIDANMSDFIDYVVDYVVAHPEVARMWLYQTITDNRRSSRASLEKFHGLVAQISKYPVFQRGMDAEVFAEICLSATLSWSMYANARITAERPAEEWVARFSREFKRLLLFGATKPEAFPEAVEAVEDTKYERRSLAKKSGESHLKAVPPRAND